MQMESRFLPGYVSISAGDDPRNHLCIDVLPALSEVTQVSSKGRPLRTSLVPFRKLPSQVLPGQAVGLSWIKLSVASGMGGGSILAASIDLQMYDGDINRAVVRALP
jgi:hypothetical protein